jgi:DNA-binding YbaB/EbfC family protein
MNQQQMMAQMRKMQQDMERVQTELANTVVEGKASGDMVVIGVSGDFRVQSVKVAKDAVDPDDIETLEDLLVVAMNDALTKVQELSGKKMGAVTGGIKIPGLM